VTAPNLATGSAERRPPRWEAMTQSSDELRLEGNKLYGEKQYLKAAAAYTKAIAFDKKAGAPENAVLYR